MNDEQEPFGGCDILEPDNDSKANLAPEMRKFVKSEEPIQERAVSSTSNPKIVVKKTQMYLEPQGFSKTVTIDEDHGRKTGTAFHRQSSSTSWAEDNEDRGTGARQLSQLTLLIGKKQMRFKIADAPPPATPAHRQYSGDFDWASSRLAQSEVVVQHVKKQCGQCNLECSSLEEMSRHVAAAHPFSTRALPCEMKGCNRSFLTKEEHAEHMREHRADRPHKCPVCPSRFRHTTNLNQHIKLHAIGRRHFCEVCRRCFRSSDLLANHQTRCTGEGAGPSGAAVAGNGRALRFECHYCGKWFHYKRDQLVHERVHNGQRPYQCGYCGKGFTQSQACKIHIRTHTGERPYVCLIDACGKRFMDSSALRKHESNHFSADIPMKELRMKRREESYEEDEDGTRGRRVYQGGSRARRLSQLEMGEEGMEEEVEEEIVEEGEIPMEDQYLDYGRHLLSSSSNPNLV